MPLVVVCGPPLSGKTTRSIQLVEHIKSTTPNITCHLINEESLALDKRLIYSNSNEEKKARSKLISSLERLLDRNSLVILDSLNYIKGFRYQLYCVARAIGTLHCLMYCSGNLAAAQESNIFLDRYIPIQLTELYDRFEEPDSFARWDKPLFRVNPIDSNPPSEQILSSLLDGTAPPPNLSTQIKPTTNLTYLQQLDEKTKFIIEQISKWLQDGNVIGTLKIHPTPTNNKTSFNVEIKKRISQNELLRLQRHFIQINKVHNLDIESIGQLFIEYLNKSFSI